MFDVYRAHAVDPVKYPESKPYDWNPQINHPVLGWGSVVLVSDWEFRVRFGDSCFAWFRLDDQEVSLWPMRRCVEFARWVRRAAK